MEKPRKFYFSNPRLISEVYNILIPHFQEINNSIGKLRVFYEKAAFDDKFDRSCILFIKIPLYDFILHHKDHTSSSNVF